MATPQEDSTFERRFLFGVGDKPFFVTIGDWDSDGDLDLASANNDGGNVTILFNQGDGRFEMDGHHLVGRLPSSIAVGDLDGNEIPDIVAGNVDASVSVLLNRGNADFAPEVRYAVGELPYPVSLADLDGDQDLDVVATLPDGFFVLLNHGDGSFAPEVRVAAGDRPTNHALGDLDGDGDIDIALANDDDNAVSVLFNRGDGSFEPEIRYAVGAKSAIAIGAGDLDDDGDLDLVVSYNTGTYISILPNSGDGTFGTEVQLPVSFLAGGSFALGDLDGDGDTDLVVADALVTPSPGGGSVENYGIRLLRNRGDGEFLLAFSEFSTAGVRGRNFCVRRMTLGDVDGDGDLDIVGTTPGDDEGCVSLIRGRGDGLFFPAVKYKTGAGLSSVALGDFDEDGNLDLAGTLRAGDSVSIHLHTHLFLPAIADLVRIRAEIT